MHVPRSGEEGPLSGIRQDGVGRRESAELPPLDLELVFDLLGRRGRVDEFLPHRLVLPKDLPEHRHSVVRGSDHMGVHKVAESRTLAKVLVHLE